MRARRGSAGSEGAPPPAAAAARAAAPRIGSCQTLQGSRIAGRRWCHGGARRRLSRRIVSSTASFAYRGSQIAPRWRPAPVRRDRPGSRKSGRSWHLARHYQGFPADFARRLPARHLAVAGDVRAAPASLARRPSPGARGGRQSRAGVRPPGWPHGLFRRSIFVIASGHRPGCRGAGATSPAPQEEENKRDEIYDK